MQSRVRRFVAGVRDRRKVKSEKMRKSFLAIKAKTAKKIARMNGCPFIRGDEKELLERVRRRVIARPQNPRSIDNRNEALLQSLFGAKQAGLGLIVVKPSAFVSSKAMRTFLRALGCDIVFTKNFVFSRQQLHELYPHAIKQYATFPVYGLDLISGPSKIIVFSHLPILEYEKKSGMLRHLKETNPAAYSQLVNWLSAQGSAQEVFCKLFKGSFDAPQPGTIRGEIVLPELRKAGFSEGGVSGEAIQLDPTGFIERHIRQGDFGVVTRSLAGIHVPDYSELLRDAHSLLSMRDLQKINALARKKGK